MLAPFCEGETAPEAVVRLGQGAAAWWAAQGAALTWNGTLVLALGRDRTELDRFARRTQSHARLDATGIAALEPLLAGRFERALHVAPEAHLNPRNALVALRKRAAALHVTFTTPGPAQGRIIDCRGLAARDTLPDLRGVKGEMMLLHAPDIALHRPIRLLHPRVPIYLVPRGQGVFMLGATMVESAERGRTTVRSVLELLSAAYALHPDFAEAEVVEIGADARPAFPDNCPRLQMRHGVLHLQVAEGMPLIRVGTLIATPLNCLLVLKDGPVKTLADLKGRKVGFSVAGLEEAVLGAMLKPHGLTMADVTLVNVNWSLSPALMSGQVDAVIGAFRNFELTQMALAGVEGRCFYPEEEGVPAYDELIYIANSKTMDVAKTRRFLAATERAAQFIVNHPKEAWAIFAATSPELQDALNKQAWLDTLPRFSQSPAALDAGRYATFETFLAGAGLVQGRRAVSQLAVDLGAKE